MALGAQTLGGRWRRGRLKKAPSKVGRVDAGFWENQHRAQTLKMRTLWPASCHLILDLAVTPSSAHGLVTNALDRHFKFQVREDDRTHFQGPGSLLSGES